MKDATRPPGRKPLTARKIKQVVNLTLNEKPPDATHWSERTMAARTGIAPTSVHKIWDEARRAEQAELLRLLALLAQPAPDLGALRSGQSGGGIDAQAGQ